MIARTQKKESHETEYREVFPKMYKTYEALRNECSERGNFSKGRAAKYTSEFQFALKIYLLESAKQGYAQVQLSGHQIGLGDINIKCDDVVHAADKTIERFIHDLRAKIDGREDDIAGIFDFMEYRLRFASVYYAGKAFNYGVIKGYAVQGVKKLHLDLTDTHKNRNPVIQTDNFDIDSIPPFSSYCSCSIKRPKQRSQT